MSIRQTRGAILFLCAQYRAILFKGFALAAASAALATQAIAADDTILENFDPSKGSLKEQRPAVDHAVADKAVALTAGTELETGDDITLTINLTGSDAGAPFITGADGSVAGVVVGEDKGTGVLELNGSGAIGKISGTGSLKANASTKLDSNTVSAQSIGSADSRFGDVSVGAHGGSLETDQAYVKSISLGESASLASQGAVSASARIDLAKDARLEASTLELAGGSSSVLYGADGAEIGASELKLSSGSSAYVKSSFDKRASVLVAGALGFGDGFEVASLIAGRNGAIYIGKSYDLLGFSDVSNSLIGDGADKAKSLAIIDTPVDLGATGGILLDGDLEAAVSPSTKAAAGTVTLRNGASIFLSSGSTASSSQSYIAAGGKAASYSLDDTSSLYIRDAGAIGDVTGGSLFVNSEVSGTSSNMDVTMGSADAKELVLTGKLTAGNLAASEEININSGSTLVARDITAKDLLVGNGGGKNVSVTADSITTTGLFTALDNGVNSISIDVKAGSITSSGQFKVEGQGARVESTGNITFNNIENAGVSNGATLAAGNAIILNGTLKADSASIKTKGLHLNGTLELSNGATFYSDADGTVSDDGDLTNDSVINLGSVISDPSGQGSADQTATKGRVKLAGSTFTASHKAAVELFGTRSSATGGANASYDNTQQFDLDAGSTLVISDLGEMDIDEVNALKAKLFLDPSKGTLAGYTIKVDTLPDGSVPFADSPKYSGTTFISGKLVTGVNGSISGTNNFGAASLAAGQDALSIGAGSSLSLNAASVNGGNFAATASGAAADVNVGSGGYIALRGDGQIGNISGDGTLQAQNGTVKAGDVSVGAFNFTSGAEVTASSLSSSGASTVADSTATVLRDLTLNDATLQNSRLLVGGTLGINGTVSVDPSYVTAGDLFIGATGLLNVLKDAVVLDGTEVSYSDSSSAALVLNNQLDLSAGGKVYIDGGIENSAAPTYASLDTSYAGKQLIIKDGELVVTPAAVADAGSGAVVKLASDDAVEVGDNGTIKLSGFKVSKSASFTLFDHATGVTTDDLSSGNVLYSASIDSVGQNVTYSLNNAGVAATFSLLMPKLAGAIVARALSDDDSANYFDSTEKSAVGLVSAFLENPDAANARSLNTLSSYAFASGSARNALASSEAGYSAVEQRAGYRGQNAAAIGAVQGHDFTVWATPIYRYHNSDSYSFDGGDYGADTSLYGVAVGADMAFTPAFRAGLAVNAGHGKSESNGDLNYVKNDFDFYGVELYGIYEQGSLNVLGDIGYTFVDNDTSGFDGFKADFDSKVFTAGVTGKYTFALSALDIAPHFGVRFVSGHIDDYDVKAGGVKYMDADSITQNIVKFPLGVTFSKTFTSGDWKIKPVGDITVTAVAGDRDVDSDVKLVGFNKFSVNGDVVDAISGTATVGLDAQKGANLGLGLGVSYTGASNENETSVQGSFRYAF